MDPRTASRFPALSPGILTSPTRDGGVIYDLLTSRLSFLDRPAAALAAACQAQASFDAVTSEWAAATGAPLDRVRGDTATALDAFATAGFTGRTTPAPRTFPAYAPPGHLGDGDHVTTQAAGLRRIRVRSTDPSLVALVERTWGLATGDEPDAEFVVVEQDDGIRLVTDTEWRYADRADLAAGLVTVLNDFVARTAGALMLHAATLRAPAGQVVVFPGAPGSGKSTLAAVLTQHGWDLAADESTTVLAGNLTVVPCAKPIGLDASSCQVLGLAAGTAGDVAVDEIAGRPARIVDELPAPAAVVLPSYVGPGAGRDLDLEANTGTERLDGADALVALVANSLNLRYAGSEALAALVALAETVPVHTISYADRDQAVAMLAELGHDSFERRG